jgi:hypothetical protein
MSSANLQIRHESNSTDIRMEIINLHDEIRQHAESMLIKAIRIGELLVEQKHKMQHGQFTQWITDNLPFSVRSAQNYMKVFINRKQLKNENVSLLSDAYNILKLPRPQFNESEDGKKAFITISLDKIQIEALESAIELARELLGTRSPSESIYYIVYDWVMSV